MVYNILTENAKTKFIQIPRTIAALKKIKKKSKINLYIIRLDVSFLVLCYFCFNFLIAPSNVFPSMKSLYDD